MMNANLWSDTSSSEYINSVCVLINTWVNPITNVCCAAMMRKYLPNTKLWFHTTGSSDRFFTTNTSYPWFGYSLASECYYSWRRINFVLIDAVSIRQKYDISGTEYLSNQEGILIIIRSSTQLTHFICWEGIVFINYRKRTSAYYIAHSWDELFSMRWKFFKGGMCGEYLCCKYSIFCKFLSITSHKYWLTNTSQYLLICLSG